MLDFLKAEEELVPVEADEVVHAARGVLSKAVAELEQHEARERRYVSIMDGTAERVSNDEFLEAHDQISVRKGTQTGFFLPAAEEARRKLVPLVQAYDGAVKKAKDQLNQAGLSRLKTLCGELGPLLIKAMEIAAQIEELRQEVGQGGGDFGGHPVPSLLPGQIVDFQVDIAKAQGFL